MRGELAVGKLGRRDLQKQIEPFDQKAERHHRNRSANPGEKGALVGSVVTVALDHEKKPPLRTIKQKSSRHAPPHFPTASRGRGKNPVTAARETLPAQRGEVTSTSPFTAETCARRP